VHAPHGAFGTYYHQEDCYKKIEPVPESSDVFRGMRSRGRIMNIYVGNLPYSVTDDELRAAFADFGEVSSANVIMDRMSGRSKGFGFVEMPNDSEAEEAINALNESAFNGRNIKVNQARPRGDRPQGGRSRY
jgi:RNA recognition motif-containing protein